MMNYVYARRDTVAETFSPLLVAGSDELACRVFLQVFGIPGVVDRKDMLYFRLGVFNNETGGLEGHDPVNITDLVNQYFDDVVEYQKQLQQKETK